MNKKILIGIFIIVLVGVAVGGAVAFLRPFDPLTPPATDDTGNTPEGISEVVSGNNKFAIDIYKELIKDAEILKEKNLFFSPYSISSAIAMTYEGADGNTAKEIKDTFYLPEHDILRPNFASLYNTINKKEKVYDLRTGNALWANKDYKFLNSYLDAVEKYYGGKVTNLDFAKEPIISTETINKFISEQTNNRIKDMLSSDSVNADTKLILTNAIYFKGKWATQFKKSNTKNLEFKTPNGTVTTPIMSMSPESNEKFNYYETDSLQILELPYKDEELSMLILLPKAEDGLDNLEKQLSNEYLDELLNNLVKTNVTKINIPKFEFTTNKIQLNTPLKNLGMKDAFIEYTANFSKMDGTQLLYIEDVIHKAFIKVDEEGTEAAAATAITMKTTSAYISSIIFNADHPFLFLIKENSTDLILFMGRITDPSS